MGGGLESWRIEAGWNIRYLVDGQSPLGPPETPPAPNCLGWHGDLAATQDTVIWAAVDLGSTRVVERVRLIAAKGHSPVKGPGFGFRVGFRIETSPTPAGDDWTEVRSTGTEPFRNPAYNPVSIPFNPVAARRVRLLIDKQHQPDPLTAPRVLLSEFEVYEGDANRSIGKPMTTSDRVKSRPHDGKRVWSGDGLTDGHSSTGTLIPLRQWVEQLALRFDLSVEGGTPLNSHIARMILATFNAVPRARPDIDLTERERETLALLGKGLIKKEIADRLGVSSHTVDTHVRNIYGKLQVHNLSAAVAKAMRLRLI